MIFAILFVLAFVIGLVCYVLSDNWWAGVVISLLLFTANVLSDSAAQQYWVITLIFGLPIVFAASLFGAYVVQLRRVNPDEDKHED